MKKRTIIIGLLVIIVAGGFYGLREYNRKPTGAEGRKPDETVSASDLLRAFTTDETAANKRFNDRVVQVSGTVASVGAPENDKVTVLLETGDALSSVACEFEAAAVPKLSSGQAITVKGICAGFNLDVLLQRCAVE